MAAPPLAHPLRETWKHATGIVAFRISSARSSTAALRHHSGMQDNSGWYGVLLTQDTAHQPFQEREILSDAARQSMFTPARMWLAGNSS
jgi:hypothetical protein